jgi:hypothetical protein
VGKDGTALAQGRSPPLPRGRLYPPTASAPDLGAGLTRRPRDPLSHACLPPAASFPPPFAFRLASTHLGWGTRQRFTRRSRDPPPRVSKHRHLGITFCHKSSLVSCNHPVLVLLVAEHPLGSHNVLLWTWHLAPDFVPFKVVRLFLHGQHPVRILQGLFYPKRLNRRDKRVMLTKGS